MKKLFLIGLIICLIIVGVLWFQVFNVTGLFWCKSKPHTLSEKSPPDVPELIPSPILPVNIEEELQKLEKSEVLPKVKDSRLYTVKCECDSCQNVLAECEGGNLCPTARRQARELGIKL